MAKRIIEQIKLDGTVKYIVQYKMALWFEKIVYVWKNVAEFNNYELALKFYNGEDLYRTRILDSEEE